MGHSLEVHLRSYPWASASNTAAAFAQAAIRHSKASPASESRARRELKTQTLDGY
jgi:hypothetical protein